MPVQKFADQVGVTRQTVYQWLKNKDEPETFRWKTINGILNVDICPEIPGNSGTKGGSTEAVEGVAVNNQGLVELARALGGIEERIRAMGQDIAQIASRLDRIETEEKEQPRHPERARRKS